jgi:rare lipoprotein A
MAFSLKLRSLFLVGCLSVLLLVAMQEAAQAEPVVSSYYGGELAGNPTASGEPFDPRGLTAAHPSLPFGAMLTVSYNGRSINVRVNDRGPFEAGRGLDLSLGAARTLGLTGPGSGVVDIKPAGAPEAKPPAPQSETTEPARPTRAVSSARTAPSDEVHEQEESPKFLSENTLAPPGERKVDSMDQASSPQPQEINALHGPTFREEPPATEIPETSKDEATQPLHMSLTIPGRRRVA